MKLTPPRTWALWMLFVPVFLVGFVWVAEATRLPVPDGFLNTLVPLVMLVAFIGGTVAVWRSSAHWFRKILATLATLLAVGLGVLVALAVLFRGVH